MIPLLELLVILSADVALCPITSPSSSAGQRSLSMFYFYQSFPCDHIWKMSIIWLQFSSSAAIFWCLRRSRPRIGAACVSSWTVSFSYWKSSIVILTRWLHGALSNFLLKFPMVFFRSWLLFLQSFFWRSSLLFRWIFAEKNNRSSTRTPR